MTSITYSPVTIQTSAQSLPSTPSWFGEAAIMAHYLTRLGTLSAIGERVRFARVRHEAASRIVWQRDQTCCSISSTLRGKTGR